MTSSGPALRGGKAASAIKHVYSLLSEAFGPQGWWPVTPAGKNSSVYRPGFHGPLSDAAIFEICAGAILTQNTSWKNVQKAMEALAAAGMLSQGNIAACPLPRLAGLVRPSGYYRRKADKLRAFSRRALKEHPEGLKSWFGAAGADELRRELLSYSGVGPETADCMALYGGGKLSFVIDAYTRRIGSRLGLAGPDGLSYDSWKGLFERSLPPDVKMYNEYHALLVKLGKDFCRPRAPFCRACPLAAVCKREKHGN